MDISPRVESPAMYPLYDRVALRNDQTPMKTDHSLRLLIRKNMFELYVDDMFVQTFNTTHAPGSIGATPQRIGFIAQNGQGLLGNLRVWSMDLDEPD